MNKLYSKILVVLLFVCFWVSPSFAEDSFAEDKKFNISFSPVLLLFFGVIDMSGEIRATESIAVGLNYSYWKSNYGDLVDTQESIFSSTILYSRYYFNGNKDGGFVGLGFVNVNFESPNNDFPPTTSLFKRSGGFGEIGYQWRWESVFQGLSYGRWFLEDIENPTGTDLELSGGPGLAYRVGVYF